jgi:hypothetical protein
MAGTPLTGSQNYVSSAAIDSARRAGFSAIIVRALTAGLKAACIALYGLAAIGVEMTWNWFDGEAVSFWGSFSIQLLVCGALAGWSFVRTTPTAQRLYLQPSTYLLAQAGSGVVFTSIASVLYYLVVGLLNLAYLPKTFGTLLGITATPVIIAFNALPYTLLVGSLTGVLTGLLLMRRKL